MTATRGNIGFERKIGYSFLGLMAGNVASLVVLLLIAVLPLVDAFTGIRQLWKLDTGGALELSQSCFFGRRSWQTFTGLRRR